MPDNPQLPCLIQCHLLSFCLLCPIKVSHVYIFEKQSHFVSFSGHSIMISFIKCLLVALKGGTRTQGGLVKDVWEVKLKHLGLSVAENHHRGLPILLFIMLQLMHKLHSIKLSAVLPNCQLLCQQKERAEKEVSKTSSTGMKTIISSS